jgi:hypothetical protein
MVVVVAGVDAVENVSLTQSGPIWRCAYRCAKLKITRGGFWDALPDDAACSLIFPKLSKPRSVFSTMFSPLVCYAHLLLAATGHCWLEDRLQLVIEDDHRPL